VRKSKNRIFKF